MSAHGSFVKAALSALALLASLSPAFAAGNCYFPKRPPITLKDVSGHCGFDPETQTFTGSAAGQARCLLTPVRPVGRLGSPLETLPEAFADFVGTSKALPARGVRPAGERVPGNLAAHDALPEAPAVVGIGQRGADSLAPPAGQVREVAQAQR